ncbi:hypothetical protein KSP40_PGU001336 [Platanthera guangdongensis]|uniref:Uncharacterized protein n=1 Tax=Platanthera guangdongensis TaxID=2320717 RepID=A0ABR2MWI6_9ASPA
MGLYSVTHFMFPQSIELPSPRRSLSWTKTLLGYRSPQRQQASSELSPGDIFPLRHLSGVLLPGSHLSRALAFFLRSVSLT